jgi:hypothetical protein
MPTEITTERMSSISSITLQNATALAPQVLGAGAPFLVRVTNGDSAALIAGMPVYISAPGVVKPARADDFATSRVLGFVTDPSIAPGARGIVQIGCLVTLTTMQWDAISGQSGGLSAVTYYLSAAIAGHITTAPPDPPNALVVLGDALDALNFNFSKQTPE